MSVKKLASQTLWYGVPTIFGRFLGYFMNILLLWLYIPAQTATISLVYSLIPFLNIIFTYGLETSFFRFVKEYGLKKVYNSFMTSVLISSSFLAILFYFLAPTLATVLKGNDYPQLFQWMVIILFFDTIAQIIFAKIRYEERPRKYAFAKMLNVVLQLIFVIIFLGLMPKLAASNPNSLWLLFYSSNIGIGYYVIANIIASICTFLFLWKDFIDFKIDFDKALLKKVLQYSLPLLIVGLGGMVNELLSRLGYQLMASGTEEQNRHELGVFSGCYKLVVLITIFIQAYKMAVEPFFFKKSSEGDAKKTYARLMKMYVIASCVMYLFIVLFIDVWKLIITWKHPEYGEAISIVPILSLGAVFLGIYYNQSIWYKLTDKNAIGAWITIIGALITILLNVILIPIFKYNGAAYATVCCYIFMMIASYKLGQKYYAIDYPLKKMGIYLGVSLLLYLAHHFICLNIANIYFKIILGFLLILVFILLVLKMDKDEFKGLPIIGKFLK